MDLPILHKLKDGEKFDFATLAKCIEQTDDFLNWWWEEKTEEGKIFRPEIILDDDPILTPTHRKMAVDLKSCVEFFDKPLFRLLQNRVLPVMEHCRRDSFRSFAIQFVAQNNSVKLSGRPQIVFAGGGYGSGKTTTVNFLAKEEKLPVGLPHLVGVDVFKPLIPEYNLIKAVADGRASLTVQQECQTLAAELFQKLVDDGRSFVWDSSMSNKNETLERVKIAAQNGYELTMVAVLTPLQQAVKQAMHRAKDSRRFPHPDALPQSHIGFRKAFDAYVEHFDEILVFANDAKLGNVPVVVGHKQGKENALVPVAGDLLEYALRLKDAE